MAFPDDTPFGNFNFVLTFTENRLSGNSGAGPANLAGGAFAECSGLEATMEPKVIREGGLNYGAHIRSGPVSFATVVLRRGMSTNYDLWKWFMLTTSAGAFSYRLDVAVTHMDGQGNALRNWTLSRAIPVKFKSSDLSSRSGEIAIEELHLAHEGLSLSN
jgi:phage tail-like protein